MLKGLQNIHFIGIGGAGMSAIAHVLLKRGYQVSGLILMPVIWELSLLKRALWFTWVMPNVRSTMSTP